jgi:phosphatidylglycerophosphate synthase
MEHQDRSRWHALPNLITVTRLVGSPGLVILAAAGHASWLAGWAVALILTEWLDGFLARRLHATSTLGARLDSIADAFFYLSLLIAVVILRPELMWRETAWIASAILSYWLSWLACWLKFRGPPSYHNWTAKSAWVVVGVGTIWLLASGQPWPFRLAMACVVLANLESIGITLVLPEDRVDVPSLYHAVRLRRGLSA